MRLLTKKINYYCNFFFLLCLTLFIIIAQWQQMNTSNKFQLVIVISGPIITRFIKRKSKFKLKTFSRPFSPMRCAVDFVNTEDVTNTVGKWCFRMSRSNIAWFCFESFVLIQCPSRGVCFFSSIFIFISGQVWVCSLHLLFVPIIFIIVDFFPRILSKISSLFDGRHWKLRSSSMHI